MFSRWIWIFLAVVISTGVYFTIRYGLRPKPIPVMNPTQFDRLEQIGAVLYRRLRQNIRGERVLLLGSSMKLRHYERVWTGLIKAAQEDRLRLTLYVKEGLSPIPETDKLKIVRFQEADIDKDLIERLNRNKKAGQLLIVHVPTEQATHLVKNSLSRRLDKVLRHPVLSLSTLGFAVNETELDDLEPKCLDTTVDKTGARELDCAVEKVARKFARKKLSPHAIWAVIERHGLKEYLAFIHSPHL